jgi:hypothetical protein
MHLISGSTYQITSYTSIHLRTSNQLAWIRRGTRWMKPLKSRYRHQASSTQQLQPHQETTDSSGTRETRLWMRRTNTHLECSYSHTCINIVLWWALAWCIYTSSSRSQHNMKRIHTYTSSRPENYIHPPPKLSEAGSSAPRKLSSNLEQMNIV